LFLDDKYTTNFRKKQKKAQIWNIQICAIKFLRYYSFLKEVV